MLFAGTAKWLAAPSFSTTFIDVGYRVIGSANVSDAPRDAQLFELFCRAVETALKYVRIAKAGRSRIKRYWPWPYLHPLENGLTCLDYSLIDVEAGNDGPEDYASVIQDSFPIPFAVGSAQQPQGFSEEPSFLALAEYARMNPRLRELLGFDECGGHGADHLREIVGSILNRYGHIQNTRALSRDKFLKIYRPMEDFLLDRTLPISVAVPILFLTFDFQNLEIDDIHSIERISDEVQIGRGWLGPFRNIPEFYLQSTAASHALVIRNHHIEIEAWDWELRMMLHPYALFPDQDIETFFAALRIATGFSTGYSQQLVLPSGWAYKYVGDIVPVPFHRVNNYPQSFNWEGPIPKLGRGDAGSIAEIFVGIRRILDPEESRRVRLAIRRLNLAELRDSEEDRVVDCMIAMEALLGDQDETTHKIAMRLAALYKLSRDFVRADEAFNELKKAYAYRSALVHGGRNQEKLRKIERRGEEMATADVAFEHLRNALFVLIRNPSLLRPSEIDSYLRTDKLAPEDVRNDGPASLSK